MLVNKNKHNAINLNLHLMQFEVFLSRDDRESKQNYNYSSKTNLISTKIFPMKIVTADK